MHTSCLVIVVSVVDDIRGRIVLPTALSLHHWLMVGVAQSASLGQEKIMEASRKSGARFLYEATVRDPHWSSLTNLASQPLNLRSVLGSPLWVRFRRCSEQATR